MIVTNANVKTVGSADNVPSLNFHSSISLACFIFQEIFSPSLNTPRKTASFPATIEIDRHVISAYSPEKREWRLHFGMSNLTALFDGV